MSTFGSCTHGSPFTCGLPRVGALLDDEHLIACRAKGEFSNDSSATELFRREVLEARNDATVGRDCDQLNGP